MALKYGFFNSVNGDRKYTAEDMMNPYRGIVSNGVVAHQDKSDGFQVLAKDGLKVVVKAGFGIFAGRWCVNDADMELELNQPHVTLSRIDSVIVRVDTSLEARNITLRLVSPLPSDSPEPIELTRTDTITEYRLANITVEPNAVDITQADIEDTRPTSECGFVSNLLQNSDITATYEQWEAQFREWMEEKKAVQEAFQAESEAEHETWTQEKKTAYDEWFSNLTEDLAVGNVGFQTYDNSYTAPSDGVSEIRIGINEFSSSNDVLSVFVNGLKLVPNVDYTLNGYETITLAKAIDAGTVVSFFLLKTVLVSNYDTLVQQVADLSKKVDAGGGGGGGVATNSEHFTFVVDSNEALAEWVTNDRTKGQDYTSVLIRKGEWEYIFDSLSYYGEGGQLIPYVGVALDITQTYRVIGEYGSKLKFEISPQINTLTYAVGLGVVYLIQSFPSLGLGMDVSAENVTIEFVNNSSMVTGDSPQNSDNCLLYGFYGLYRIRHCRFIYTDNTGKGNVLGFVSCLGLEYCAVSGTGAGNEAGFYSCMGMRYCGINKHESNAVLTQYGCYASWDNIDEYAVANTPAGGFNLTTNLAE